MAKKKDATPKGKGVSDKDKDLKPDTQKETQEPEPETIEEEKEEKQTVESRMSERQNEVERMAERMENEREREAGVSEDEKGVDGKQEEEEETPEKTEETDEEEPEGTKEEAADKEETREIIVDGVKKTVPLSEIIDAGIRTLQKESAADKRLEEAVRLLKEAKEASGQLPKDKQTKDDEDKKNTKEQDFQKLSKGIDKKKIAEIREAIQYGEENEADKALEELLSLVTPNIPENVMTVDDYEKKERERLEKQIIDKFSLPPDKGGFKDIMDDPYLFAAHTVEVDTELAKGTPNDWELYKKAGEKVRKWRGTPKDENALKEAADQKAKDDLAQKREKKAKAASATVKGVNVKTETSKKADDKEDSPSEIIRQMRAARGQPI